MLVTVTFDISTLDQKEVLYTDIYAYVDIEVTDEEYKKIGQSFECYLFRGMYEDASLSEICDRCREALKNWFFEEELGEDILYRFDYPIETRIDHLSPLRVNLPLENNEEEMKPSNAHLFKNEDGTYTVWWTDESA